MSDPVFGTTQLVCKTLKGDVIIYIPFGWTFERYKAAWEKTYRDYAESGGKACVTIFEADAIMNDVLAENERPKNDPDSISSGKH